MAKVDILMPVHNPQVKWLAECMLSIMKQTFTDWRLVMVVDGPNKPEIEEEFQVFLENIKSIKNEIKIVRLPSNLGVGGALRAGASECEAKYIARMDCDDIMLPERLQIQYEYMEKNENVDVDVLSTGLKYMFTQDGSNWKLALDSVSHPEVITKEIAKSSFWFMNHPTTMIRKKSLEIVGSYNENLKGMAEDYELWIRMLKNDCVLRNIPDPLLYLRLNPKSASKNFKAENIAFLKKLQDSL